MPTLPTSVDITFAMRHATLARTWAAAGGAYFHAAHGAPVDSAGVVDAWAPIEGAHRGTAAGGVTADYDLLGGQRAILCDGVDGVMRFSGFAGRISGQDIGFSTMLEGWLVAYNSGVAVMWSASRAAEAAEPMHRLVARSISPNWLSERQGDADSSPVQKSSSVAALATGARFQLATSFTGSWLRAQLTTGSGTTALIDAACDSGALTLDTFSVGAGVFDGLFTPTNLAVRAFAFRLGAFSVGDFAALAAGFGR